MHRPPFIRKKMNHSEKEFPALVVGKKYTAILTSIKPGKVVALAFDSPRAMESFKAMAVKSNARGENPAYFSVRLDYRQRIVTIISKTRQEYEQSRTPGGDTPRAEKDE